jgi:putative lipoic acid-binding regulatory protein
VPNFSDRALQVRDSKNGKYCALNITVHVESREQLDNIYQALTASPQVLMAL